MANSYFWRGWERLSCPRFNSCVIGGLILTCCLIGNAFANPKYAGFVIDAKTGEVLYSQNSDAKRYPASLTKMMTLYLTFEALDAGVFTENSRITVSRHAASEPPSKIGLRAGSTITVEQAMHAMVTKSANDAATALGEFVGKSEAGFATLATWKARALGMTSTTFRNAHGLPDSRQVTTARDMALLGIALREHFPHHYDIFQTRSYRFRNTTLRSHNRLVGSVKGVDGIKTGFVNASGFNVVTSVMRDGRSVVGVVLGGRTAASRDAHMRDLIKRYLPSASRAGRGGLVPRPNDGSLVAGIGATLPENGPVPGMRKAADLTERRVADVVLDSALPFQDAKEPGQQGIAAAVTQQQAAIDPQSTGGVINNLANGQWSIQLAAVPEEQAAMQILDQASSDHSDLLGGVDPLVVEHIDGGSKIYRARFIGFEGKSSARSACAVLKKKGYGCWASQ
jgi:D-alanyl-D-alanine carboxypeptidase